LEVGSGQLSITMEFDNELSYDDTNEDSKDIQNVPLDTKKYDKNASESTEAEVVSELGSDYNDNISSLGDIYEDNQRRERRVIKNRVSVVNRMKTEIAVLEEKLRAAEANDKLILLGRLREAKIDNDNLIARNSRLRSYTTELETSLFEILELWRKLVSTNSAKKSNNVMNENDTVNETIITASQGMPSTPNQMYYSDMSNNDTPYNMNESSMSIKLNSLLNTYERNYSYMKVLHYD
jgi:hypothetical protein